MKYSKWIENEVSGLYFNKYLVTRNNEIYRLPEFEEIFSSKSNVVLLNYIDGKIYFASKNEYPSIYVVEVENKQQKLLVKDYYKTGEAIKLIDDNNIYTFNKKACKLTKRNHLDEIIWQIGFDSSNLFMVGDNIIAISVGDDFYVEAFEQSTGKRLWLKDKNLLIGEKCFCSGNIRITQQSPMINENCMVIHLWELGYYCISIKDGKGLWYRNMGGNICRQFLEVFYVLGDNLSEIDIDTGNILKEKSIKDILDCSINEITDALIAIQGICVCEKYIIFGNKGYLWFIDRHTLTLKETIMLDTPKSVYSGAPVYVDGYVYVVDGHNNLHIIKDE